MVKINWDQSDIQLKKEIQKLHSADITLLIKNSDEEIQDRIFKLIDRKLMIKIIPELVDEIAIRFIRSISDKEKGLILNALKSDDLKYLLMLFKSEEQENYLKLLNKQEQVKTLNLLSYDDEVSASIMSTDFIMIQKTMSIKEATSYLISTVEEKNYLDTLFVTDANEKLLGILDVKDLIIARTNKSIEDLMNTTFYYVLEDTSLHVAISKIKNYHLKVLPVLNQSHELLGIITADDVLYKMAEEHVSDYQEIVAISDHTDELSPLKRSLQRLPWLLISVIMNLVIAGALSVFQATLEEILSLVLFQPMILGMAGNIGTQSLAVTILGIHNKSLIKGSHIMKETLIALINSAILGFIAIIIVWLFLSILPPDNVESSRIAFVVGLSLFGGMFISALAGVLLPLLLNKLGFDEAIASGPMISTVNDFTALGVYFVIATFFLLT